MLKKTKINIEDVVLLDDEFLHFIGTENIKNAQFDKIQKVGKISNEYFCYWASNKEIPLKFIIKNYGNVDPYSICKSEYTNI